MKNILLIHTGGTFGMVPTEPHKTLAPGNLREQLHSHAPELTKLANIDIDIPFNADSSNISAKEWDLLAKIIHSKRRQYDGFVIIHGTDTMVFTASALSFTLLRLKKPVILTGSQRPLSELRSDARENLIDAVELATMKLPEVMIVFGQKVIRGNRAKKTSITSYEAFKSPNYPLIGEIGLRIEMNSKHLLSDSRAYRFKPGFSGDIMVINALPALNPAHVGQITDSGCRALIVLGFGAGNLPDSNPGWITLIRDLGDHGIPVFISSQSMHGNTDLTIYQNSRKAMEAGAVGLGDMTIESSYVKLLKVLAYASEKEEIIDMMLDNWAGEISG